MPLALINLIMFLHARQTLSQLLRHKQQAAAAAAVAAVGNTPQRNNVAQPLTVAPRFHTAGCHSRHGGAGWSNGFVTPPDCDNSIKCLHARQTLSQLLHHKQQAAAAGAAAAAAAVANTWQRNNETQPLAVAPRFHTAGCHSRHGGAGCSNAFVAPPVVDKMIMCLHARQTLSQLLHSWQVGNTRQRNNVAQPLTVAPRFHTAGCHSRRSGAWIPNCNAFVMPPIVCKPTKLFIT